VGYHGRDVDSIIKDLVDAAMALVRGKLRERAAQRIAEAVRQRLLMQLQPAELRGGAVSQELQDQYEWVARLAGWGCVMTSERRGQAAVACSCCADHGVAPLLKLAPVCPPTGCSGLPGAGLHRSVHLP
jgi:hypothetical protein